MIHSLLNKYLLHEVPRDPVTLTALGTSVAALTTAGSTAAAAGSVATGAGLSASTIGGMGLTAAGGGIGALGALTQGKTAQEVASYKATQDTINASQAIAAAQRQSLDKTLQTKLAISSLRARGAGSGINLTSPSATTAAGAIKSRGAYQAGMDLWQGENTATGLLNEAEATLATGKAQDIGSEYSAAGTIAGMGASMFQQYGMSLYPYQRNSTLGSDVRLKQLLEVVGEIDGGLKLYRFNYLSDPAAEYVGVAAQEVQAVRPDAVVEGADGYLRVDYEALGIEMLTWREWLRCGKPHQYGDRQNGVVF